MTRPLAFVVALAFATPAPAQDASGRWDVTVTTPNRQHTALMAVKKEADKLSGTIQRAGHEAIPVAGTQQGADIALSFSVPTQDGLIEVTMKGRQDGESIKGTIDLGREGQGEWTASRSAAPAAAAGDLTGTWEFHVQTDMGSATPVATIKQEGEKLTGLYKGQLGEAPLSGQARDAAFSFEVTVSYDGKPLVLTYAGTVDKNAMKGRVTIGDLGDGTFTAAKRGDR